MSIAHIHEQQGDYPIYRLFQNSKFRYVMAFSDTAAVSGISVTDRDQFLVNEFLELRGYTDDLWEKTTCNLVTNTLVNSLTIPSGVSTGGPVTPASVGLLIFAGERTIGSVPDGTFKPLDTTWLTETTGSSAVATEFTSDAWDDTVTGNPFFQNWDWCLFPNQFLSVGPNTLHSARSWSISGRGTIAARVNFFDIDPPLPLGAKTFLPVGIDLAIVDAYSGAPINTTPIDITFNMRSGGYQAITY